MSAQPAIISRKRRAARGGSADTELSFESLRTEGIRLAQALSGHAWTDYNLHDPGVTLLEQLCYALTDLVYRADFPVADHLRGPSGEGIAYADLCLHRPDEVFPCRATSADDYRRLLLDQVAGLDDARLLGDATRSEAATEPALPRGLYKLMLKLAPGEPPGGETRLADARRAYRAHRNLCEDIDAEIIEVRDVLCSLKVDVELAGPRDPVDVLADIYVRCALHIAQGLTFHSRDELQARGLSLEKIYTGPLTTSGFAVESDAAVPELLFVSDLAALAKGVDGVHELRSLSLVRDGDTGRSAALTWRQGDGALRLRVPGLTPDARSPDAVQRLVTRDITLRRRGTQLRVSPSVLIHRLADLYAASRTGHRVAASGKVEMPVGQYRNLERYYSLQNDLPAVYGVGRAGVPPSATLQQRAQIQQLTAYLTLFEQVIANSAAQIEHLRELFSVTAPRGPTNWWNVLSSQEIPGLDELYLPPPDLKGTQPRTPERQQVLRDHIHAEVYQRRDPHPDRKTRVMDHLLALHGETFTQNSIRQFSDFLSPTELDAALLDNKAAFLTDIVSLTRDRASGLDYGEVSWGAPRSGSGLQRRVGRLLGFHQVHCRSLLDPFRQARLTLVPVDQDRPLGPLLNAGLTRAVPPYLKRLTHAELMADLAKMQLGAGRAISEALLRCGLAREHYRLHGAPLDRLGMADPSERPRLTLGPDELGRWWPLGEFENEELAARAASSLRYYLIHLCRESEGLHVVEHVLLRPVGDSPAHVRLKGLPANFFELRLTAVFPAWTTRCAQPNFQRLADETVQLNTPAHVAARCLWLEPKAMELFESRYQAWLNAKQKFCASTANERNEAQADEHARTELNDAASDVIACLLEFKSSAVEPRHA